MDVLFFSQSEVSIYLVFLLSGKTSTKYSCTHYLCLQIFNTNDFLYAGHCSQVLTANPMSFVDVPLPRRASNAWLQVGKERTGDIALLET